MRDSQLHALGPLHAGLRLGGERLLLLRRRRRRRRRGAPDHVRHRRRAASSTSTSSTTSRATRARVRCASATAPATSDSTTSGARCSTPSTCTRARATRLDERVWPMLSRQVERAIERWREPDRGIWEVRGEPKHFTSSKLLCWVACDRGARLAAMREDSEHARRAGRPPPTRSTPTSAPTASTSAACSSSTTRPTRSTRRCCSLPLVRFLPPDDERVRSHRARHRRRAHRGRARAALPRRGDRRRPRRRGGQLHHLLVLAGVRAGRDRRAATAARALCERLLALASPLGLYAEEIDPHSGRHLGNFPQAFTHLALINAVMHVIRADQELAAQLEVMSAKWR